MWKVLCLLGVFLAVPLKSHRLSHRDIMALNSRVTHEIFEKVHYSYSVPIWQYSPSEDFICEQPGYFPDPQNCQYFYKCTVGQSDHLFRFVYRCEKGRVYSPETNNCVRAAESDLVCAESLENESSMEVEDKQAESKQQTSDEITVKKLSLPDNLTNEAEEKQTLAEDLTVHSDGKAVNAPTERPVSLFSIHTPDSIKLPKIELNVSVEKRIPGFGGIKNMGLQLFKGQLFDDGKEDQDTVPVQNKPSSIPEQQNKPSSIPEQQNKPSSIPEQQNKPSSIPEQQNKPSSIPEQQNKPSSIPEQQNKPSSIPEQQTTLPPIPEMESDEKREEVPTTVRPISTTTLPSISETGEDCTTATEVETGKGQPITTISTTLHWSELTESTDKSQEEANQSVHYDEKNTSDCVDDGFHGAPEDRSKFYRCVSTGSHFVKYELQCPFGTIWDDNLKTCNFRAAIKEVTCTDKSLPATPTPPTSTTATASTIPPASADDDSGTDCPFHDIPEDRAVIICPTGFRQHPKYCNMFYQCISIDNFEVNFTSLVCPEEMVFNVENLQCEIDETRRQSCKSFEPIEKQDDGQILINSNLQLCPEEGRFIYGERCSSRYIECLRDEYGNLEGYLLKCPRGQMYSRVKDKCRPSSYFNHCPMLI